MKQAFQYQLRQQEQLWFTVPITPVGISTDFTTEKPMPRMADMTADFTITSPPTGLHFHKCYLTVPSPDPNFWTLYPARKPISLAPHMQDATTPVVIDKCMY